MNVLAMTGFIQSLIQETIDGKITWKSLVHFQNIDESNNEALYYALIENEFHSIIFLRSFYCFLPSSGYVYVINETSESGYDGSVVSGVNIYIQKNASSPLHQLTVDLSLVYQLENAILSSDLSEDEIQEFIDNYYKD